MTDTTPRQGVIPAPAREKPVMLPQCRCVLLNANGTHGDRCGGRVSDPDSPLCEGCDRNGHREQEGFAMVDLNR